MNKSVAIILLVFVSVSSYEFNKEEPVLLLLHNKEEPVLPLVPVNKEPACAIRVTTV